MKILFVMPHFYRTQAGAHASMSSPPELRIKALCQNLMAIHQLFGKQHCEIDQANMMVVPLEQHFSADVEVVLCTTGEDNLISQLPAHHTMYQHENVSIPDPMFLGFECHRVLKDHLGQFDYYCYLEDDIVLTDPLFFLKLKQFTEAFGPEALWQPYRFEMTYQIPIHKVYIDGDLRQEVTAPFQSLAERPALSASILGLPLTFKRARNPHAGCFFLNTEQMTRWAEQPYFLDRDASFVSPLESAATLGLMKTFRIYKTDNIYANLLEVMHYDYRYVQRICEAEPVV